MKKKRSKAEILKDLSESAKQRREDTSFSIVMAFLIIIPVTFMVILFYQRFGG